MDKTLNQRIYETPGDVKKAIHDFGYEEGKQAATEQIFADIGKLLDANYSDSYGTYDGKLGIAIWKLKEKYGVK